MNSITHHDVVLSCRKMGIEAGCHLMVHSSLSSIGHVSGGAVTVAEALLEVVGPDGVLMVPTFTHSGTEYYDPRLSPSKNGAITESVRHRPEAVRSLHCTHAVTVIGPSADQLVVNDLNCGPLAMGCALDLLAKCDGLILLLGVGHNVNSIIHVGEDYAGDPDRHKRWSAENPKRVILNDPDSGEREILITSMMGSTVAFDLMEDELRSRGQIVDGHIGDAACQVMLGSDVIEATKRILKPILSQSC